MKKDWKTRVGDLARLVHQKNDADIILYAGDINRPGADLLIEISRKTSRCKNAYLVLSTNGGEADSSYRIARALQRQYEKFTLFIPGICKSAGTLVAVGAQEIVISDYGELGPLDVQIGKTDELGERASGLNVTQALDSMNARALQTFRDYLLDIRYGSRSAVSTKLAAEIATNLTVGLYEPIYGQIDPVRLGEIERAINIAYDYGERLGKENLKEKGALAKLVTGYPSHGFVIDRAEAVELFKQVREPDKDEESLADAICNDLGYVVLPTDGEPTVLHLNHIGTKATSEEATDEGAGGTGKGATGKEPSVSDAHAKDDREQPAAEPEDRKGQGSNAGEEGVLLRG